MPPRTAAVATRSTGSDGSNGKNALAASTRVRQDPSRRIGNGNAVAGGLDLTRVGILSDRELAFFHRLAESGSHNTEQQRLDARQQEEQRRRELSKARTANWPDTIEARHDRFVQAQQDAKDAAEERQRVLDELYAEQLKEERQAVIARQELAQLKEDPRGRNARSMKLLHDTLKGREEQIAYKQQRKQEEAAATTDTQHELQLQAWGDQTEEMHKKLATRQRNMEEKNANLEMVLCQIDQRRQERAAEKQDRVRVEQEAAEERAEQGAEEAARRARDMENSAYNEAHRRTALTKSQKLQERLADNAQDEAAMRAEEAKLDGLKAWVKDKQQRKQDAFEKRKEAVLQEYAEAAAAEKAPTYRTQDIFAGKGQSFLQRMYDGDEKRQQQQREREREQDQRAEAGPVGAEGSGAPPPQQQQQRHKAATTAGGFLNEAEERAYAEEMRCFPELMKAEAAQEAAARRAEAKRVEEIQKMQAVEKRENARRAVEARREEARQQQQHRAQDDERYSAYLDSVMPPDMDPILCRKAKQLQ
ncbi:hypothetical protein N2W54_002053 [Lotmaria passim]